MANNVDPHQKQCSVASDLGLHNLLGLFVPIYSVVSDKMGYPYNIFLTSLGYHVVGTH